MRLEFQCPLCGNMMTMLWDTEWTDGRQRTVDVLCERCLHRETVYLAPSVPEAEKEEEWQGR